MVDDRATDVAIEAAREADGSPVVLPALPAWVVGTLTQITPFAGATVRASFAALVTSPNHAEV